MNLNTLTSSDLSKLAKLVEQKEAIQKQMAEIDAAIASFASGATTGVKMTVGKISVATVAKAGRRARRGSTKAAIVGLVQAAGKSGVTVKEISTRLKIPTNRIYTWFYATGKNVKQIKKVGEAKYAWVG